MRRRVTGVSLAFLAAPAVRVGRRYPSAIRPFVGGFILAWVLAFILWGGR